MNNNASNLMYVNEIIAKHHGKAYNSALPTWSELAFIIGQFVMVGLIIYGHNI